MLERYLGQRNINAEVINTGVSGFGTAEELAFLESDGYRYQPDVVVVGFFGNDFEDNLKANLFVLDDNEKLVENKYEHLPGVRVQNLIYTIPGLKWLSENSYFYSIVFNRVWDFFKKRLSRKAIAEANVEDEFVIPQTVTHSKQEISLAASLIERMQQYYDKHGIRLIVVDIPAPRGDFAFASSLLPLRDRLDYARVEYIDSEVLLADYAGSAPLHLPHGHLHISEFTNAMIGAGIGRRILDRRTKTKPE